MTFFTLNLLCSTVLYLISKTCLSLLSGFVFNNCQYIVWRLAAKWCSENGKDTIFVLFLIFIDRLILVYDITYYSFSYHWFYHLNLNLYNYFFVFKRCTFKLVCAKFLNIFWKKIESQHKTIRHFRFIHNTPELT